MPARLIDLSKSDPADLSHNWPGPVGANFACLPEGAHRIAGTNSDIRGLIQLSCGLMTTHPDHTMYPDQFPAERRGIRVGVTADRIHLLQGSLVGSGVFVPRGTPVVTEVVHRADSTQDSIRFKLGELTRDWWTGPSLRAQRANA